MSSSALTPDPIPLQASILRTFTVLHHLQPNWGGALILNIGLDAKGTALSLAANIAGAVCLTLEFDPARLREAQRIGSCDFIVNTLDEALRAIKNEIRQHKPISIGLEGDAAILMNEIRERGLAPLLFTAAYPDATLYLSSVKTRILDPTDFTLVDAATTPHLWHLDTFSFASAAELRAFDTLALAALLPADTLRRKWLQAIPRILPRDRTRTLWLTDEEQLSLKKVG